MGSQNAGFPTDSGHSLQTIHRMYVHNADNKKLMKKYRGLWLQGLHKVKRVSKGKLSKKLARWLLDCEMLQVSDKPLMVERKDQGVLEWLSHRAKKPEEPTSDNREEL